MKVIIIEDERKIASDLKRMLKKLDPSIEIQATHESIQQSITWLEQESRPDLIFMDIQLADGLSFPDIPKSKYYQSR
jgi:two-component SAPR family response regulator